MKTCPRCGTPLLGLESVETHRRYGRCRLSVREEIDLAVKRSLETQKVVHILWTAARAEEISQRCISSDPEPTGDVYYGAEPQGGAQGDLTWAVKLVVVPQQQEA